MTGTRETYVWDPGTANEKQKEFFRSRALYTAYGGAKGGGLCDGQAGAHRGDTPPTCRERGR